MKAFFPEVQDMVQRAVESAFEMAQTALTAMRDEQANQDIKNVMKWLFVEESKYNDEGKITLTMVTETLNGIITKREKLNEVPWDDMVVYCGMDRFEKREDGRYYDSHGDEVVSKDTQSEWRDCFDFLPNTLAYTHNPTARYPSQIQICPWFITWAKGNRYQTWEDVQKKAKFFEKALPYLSKWPFTPIDAESLLDKVILHEMTHTRAGWMSRDVPGGMNLLTARTRYGWKQCVELGKKGLPATDAKGAEKNADSIALLCSAIRIIKDPETPRRVTIDGKFEPINSATKRSAEPRHIWSPSENSFVTVTIPKKDV
ncbi:hypothetical protein GTA08_BOTSDO07478 [Neofusicoccum parvum]|uniref:Uncharacterized protein n=1 Tax=Neofusicoccum parvum TaxID=310453 RepID=A0ACB5SPJ0_9PEZI|nr:hypothetical protein GTA08_BOTSDO07478 [Neofusicoccum parvum]